MPEFDAPAQSPKPESPVDKEASARLLSQTSPPEKSKTATNPQSGSDGLNTSTSVKLPPVELINPGSAETLSAVRALHAATANDKGILPQLPNPEAINDILASKTQAELNAIKKAYKAKYDISLEDEIKKSLPFLVYFSKTYLALALLNNKDGDTTMYEAARIREALFDLGTSAATLVNSTPEKFIRDVVAKKNSNELDALRKSYAELSPNASLDFDLTHAFAVSNHTKNALAIYLKGCDKRTPSDTALLADRALKDENLIMFLEAFRDASPEARESFINNNGKQKLRKAFSGQKLEMANEYLQNGRLSEPFNISAHTGYLFNNTQAIEAAINSMSDKSRRDYIVGETINDGKKAPAEMSREEDAKVARDYRRMFSSLSAASGNNETELLRLQDLVRHKGGSIISQLAQHRGNFYNSSVTDVLSTIEDMSEKNWDRLKDKNEGSDFRRNINAMLRSILTDKKDVDRCMHVVDKKAQSSTFEQSVAEGRRSVTEIAADYRPSLLGSGGDDKKVIESILNLSASGSDPGSEKDKYCHDRNIQDKVDSALQQTLHAQNLKTARRLLVDIAQGKKAELTLPEQMTLYGSEDPYQCLQMIAEAARKDPTLARKLLHPASDNKEEKDLSRDYRQAVDINLGRNKWKLNLHADKTLETVAVPLEAYLDTSEAGLSQLRVSKQDYYQALANVSDSQRAQISNDKEYEIKVLHMLTSEERKVARFIVEQRAMHPEDWARLDVINGRSDSIDRLESLTDKPDQLKRAASEYERKYDHNLAFDLSRNLSPENNHRAQSLLRAIARPEGQLDYLREQYYLNRGVGAIGDMMIDLFDPATGMTLDGTVNNSVRVETDTAAKLKKLSPEEQTALKEQLVESLRNYKESEGAVADKLVNTAILVGGLSAAQFTGGASLSLLYYAIPAGAVLKAATKRAVLDDSDLWNDLVRGGVDGAVSVLGPGQLSCVLGIGAKAGTRAAEQTIAKLTLEGTEKLVIAEEKRAILKAGMSEIMHSSIMAGKSQVDIRDVSQLALKVAEPGQERIIATTLYGELKSAAETEAKDYLKSQLTRYSLNAGSAAIAGGLAGSPAAIENWDKDKPLATNFANAGTTVLGHALLAGSTSIVMTGALHGAQGLRSSLLKRATPEGLALTLRRVSDNGQEIVDYAEQTGSRSFAPGMNQYVAQIDGKERKLLFYAPPDLRPDEQAPILVCFDGAGVKFNKAGMPDVNDLLQFAQDNRCYAAFPEPLGRLELPRPAGGLLSDWNSQFGLNVFNARQDYDDVSFVGQLLQHTLSNDSGLRVSHPVFLTFSAGAPLAQATFAKLGSQLPAGTHLIAVCPTEYFPYPIAAPPGIGVTAFFGKSDQTFPMNGGTGKLTALLGKIGQHNGDLSQPTKLPEWYATANGWSGQTPIPKQFTNDPLFGTCVVREFPTADGVRVTTIEVEGGHMWYGRKPPNTTAGKLKIQQGKETNVKVNQLIPEFASVKPTMIDPSAPARTKLDLTPLKKVETPKLPPKIPAVLPVVIIDGERKSSN